MTGSTSRRSKHCTKNNRVTTHSHENTLSTTSPPPRPTTHQQLSTAVTYSSRSAPGSYAALRGRVVKAPWVQETKLKNTSTTHRDECTRPTTHPHGHNHPRTHQPTHPRCATAVEQSTAAAADALMMIQTELPSHWDFHVFTIIRHPGE